jgi:hypothetical protein
MGLSGRVPAVASWPLVGGGVAIEIFVAVTVEPETVPNTAT